MNIEKKFNTREYLYPSKYYNFLGDNKLVDVLQYLNFKSNKTLSKEFILNKGILFEKWIIDNF